ncbi:MAG TPA: ComEA family DNA-binding protein [Acidimicrobiia bacterium]|nr:ComEA family DNA-binding protein [Acidimicrobiia bacterium]
MSIPATYRGMDRGSCRGYLYRPGGRRGHGLKRIESAVIAALAVTLSLGAWWWTAGAGNQGDAASEASLSPMIAPAVTDTALLVVHVAGEVRRPGVVHLPIGSRVLDAIEAAGGATAAAVLSQVNLAAELVDGTQIVVPSRLESGPATAVADDGMVAVNRATITELETLPGVGPVLAGRIVAHRDEHGPFERVEDLLDVSGIGEAILGRLRPLVRIP